MKKFNQYLIFIVVLLIPFYFFRFSILGIRTNVLEIAILIVFFATLFKDLIINVITRCSCCHPRFSLGSSNKTSQLLDSTSQATGWNDNKQLIVNDNIKKVNYINLVIPILFIVSASLAVVSGEINLKALGILKGWFIIPVLFAWVLVKNLEAKDLPKLSFVLYLSLITVACIALLQKIGVVTTMFYQVGDITFNQYLVKNRIFGTFESPNYLAMFIVPSIFLSLPALKLIKDQGKKVVFVLLYILPLLALYFASSRAGIVALIISLCFYLNYRFVNLQKAQNRQPFYSGLFVAILLFVNFFYLSYAVKTFEPIRAGDKIRVEIYQYGVQLLEKNYIKGIGLGQFQTRIAQISAKDEAFRQFGLPYAMHPHNLLLAVWLNLGMAGIILFIWLLISFFKNAFSSNSSIRPAIIAAMIAILIHGLFDTTYFKNDLSIIFWMAFAFSVIIKNEKNLSIHQQAD